MFNVKTMELRDIEFREGVGMRNPMHSLSLHVCDGDTSESQEWHSLVHHCMEEPRGGSCIHLTQTMGMNARVTMVGPHW